MENDKNSGIAKTFERGLHIFEYLIIHKKVSVTQAAKILEVQKSAAYRFLNTLRILGYADQNDQNHYILTERLERLMSGLPSDIDMKSLTKRELSKLAQYSQLTANIGYFDEREIVYVAQKAIEFTYYTEGNHIPAYCSAMGKAVLAFLPEEELEKYLQQTVLVPFTPNTICCEKKLRLELKTVRELGYAVTNGEMVTGLIGMAAPIFYNNMPPRYSVSTAGISCQSVEEFIRVSRDIILSTSREIGKLMEMALYNNRQTMSLR